MPATPALCYGMLPARQFIPTKPHLLLGVSLTFSRASFGTKLPLVLYIKSLGHAFNLEITESNICYPGGYKFLLEVRVILEWYLGDFGGFDWVNHVSKYCFQNPQDLQEVGKFSKFQ